MHISEIAVGNIVRAFDPRTMGVVKTASVSRVGSMWITLDFGLTGSSTVLPREVLEVVAASWATYRP